MAWAVLCSHLYEGWVWHGWYCVVTYTRGGCGMGGTVSHLYEGWVWHGWYCVVTYTLQSYDS